MSDGSLGRAYLDAVAKRDPEPDLRVKTLVLVDSATYSSHEEFYKQHHERLLVRVPAQELVPNAVARETGGWSLVRDLAPNSAMVEIDAPSSLDIESLIEVLRRLAQDHPQLMVSVYLHYDMPSSEAGDDAVAASFCAPASCASARL